MGSDSIKVLISPTNSGQPARTLEVSEPTTKPAAARPDTQKPCCGQGRYNEAKVHNQDHKDRDGQVLDEKAPPEYLVELQQQAVVLRWMEDNLTQLHQLMTGQNDAESSRRTLLPAVEGDLEVVEETMFFCNDLAHGLLVFGEGEIACPVRAFYEHLERQLRFYARESDFLQASAVQVSNFSPEVANEQE